MRRALSVAVIGLLVGAATVGNALRHYEWNPTATVRFGEAITDQNDYARSLLGEIVLAPQAGHDGKFFFSQAMDPFYLSPDTHARFLDRPAYRAQRMLYPTLASLGGLASPRGTTWGLIVVNLLAMAVGTAATSLVAMRLGLSRWWGLSFTLNPGMLAALAIDSAGVVSFAALMSAIYLAMKEEAAWAALALTVAVLSRETMLIGAVGLAAFLWRSTRRVPIVFAAPWLAAGSWWLYVQWRLDGGLAQDTQAIGIPFVGFVRAFQTWVAEGGRLPDLLLAIALLVASIGVLVRAFVRPSALSWGVAGFPLLAVLLAEPVWARYFDSARALAPVLTAYTLLVLADGKGVGETAALGRSEAPLVG